MYISVAISACVKLLPPNVELEHSSLSLNLHVDQWKMKKHSKVNLISV